MLHKIIHISELVLHYLSLVVAVGLLFVFVVVFTKNIAYKSELIIFLLLSTVNFILGTAIRRNYYKKLKKKINYGIGDIWYFFYSLSSVFLIALFLARFLVSKNSAIEYQLTNELFENMYIYFFLLVIIIFTISLISEFLSKLAPGNVNRIVFIIVFFLLSSFIIKFIFLNANLFPNFLAELWSNPIYQNIFVVVSASPIIYYLKALYKGSDIADA